MKRLLLLVFAMCVFIAAAAGDLVFISLKQEGDVNFYLNHPGIVVNYYSPHFVIATVENQHSESWIKLDEQAWQKGENYFVAWVTHQYQQYETNVSSFSRVLYRGDNFLILKVADSDITKLYPATHSGLDAIFNWQVTQSYQRYNFDPALVSFNPVIGSFVEEVDTTVFMPKIQHLQDYGTRNCFTPQAVQAQNWIKSQFESFGLSVVLHDFMIGSQNPSDNVIATQTGLIYPDEYIVVGGHYDSYVFSGSYAPGADDNASGTSGVLEIARVLSQYSFSRSIIYCAFSGEEYGLYGSAAWVSWAKANNLNILGYINLDMIGYIQPGNGLHTHIIAPASAQPLVDFYTAVANIYVPDMGVYPGALAGGNSDHSSFNAQGYMGIFPFEDSQNYSPYIHTANDIMGLSVNSSLLAMSLTRAALASVATVADPFNGFYPPMNLSASQNSNVVELNWSQPLNIADFLEYKIYRNGEFYATVPDVNTTSFADPDVTVGDYYSYYLTASYGGSNPGESNPSNSAGIYFGLMNIYSWDFEDGTQGWTIKNTNLGWKWGLTVPITGNSTYYLGVNSDAYGQNVHIVDNAISPVLDLTNYFDLTLHFRYGFRRYSSEFMKVYYRTGVLDPWIELMNLVPSSSFKSTFVLIPEAAITATTQFGFLYDDNNVWGWYAALDDIKITGFDGTLTNVYEIHGDAGMSIVHFPNPAQQTKIFRFNLDHSTIVKLQIYDESGRLVGIPVNSTLEAGNHSIAVDVLGYRNGLYFFRLIAGDKSATGKFTVVR